MRQTTYSTQWRATLSAFSRIARRKRRMERETGIEPATNSLEGCDSTTELLPPTCLPRAPAGASAGRPATLFRTSPGRLSGAVREAIPPCQPAIIGWPSEPSFARTQRKAKDGGEGRIRTFEATGATDLQSVAFDRFATSPCLACPEHPTQTTLTRATTALSVLPATPGTVRVAMTADSGSAPFLTGPGLELAKGFEPPTG